MIGEQHRFMVMLAKLILYADSLGYRVTGGDLYRDPRAFHGSVPYGEVESWHKKRLAIDINLFRGDDWLTHREDYLPLGTYWEAMGGTWGGNFTKVDAPHFSLGEG